MSGTPGTARTERRKRQLPTATPFRENTILSDGTERCCGDDSSTGVAVPVRPRIRCRERHVLVGNPGLELRYPVVQPAKLGSHLVQEGVDLDFVVALFETD